MATVVVAMSSMKWGFFPRGMATQMGLVPSRRSRPKSGMAARMVLVRATPIIPASAAISAQTPAMPKWPESLTVVMQVPLCRAFSMVLSMAIFAAENPEPLLPLRTSETGVSCTISGFP